MTSCGLVFLNKSFLPIFFYFLCCVIVIFYYKDKCCSPFSLFGVYFCLFVFYFNTLSLLFWLFYCRQSEYRTNYSNMVDIIFCVLGIMRLPSFFFYWNLVCNITLKQVFDCISDTVYLRLCCHFVMK